MSASPHYPGFPALYPDIQLSPRPYTRTRPQPLGGLRIQGTHNAPKLDLRKKADRSQQKRSPFRLKSRSPQHTSGLKAAQSLSPRAIPRQIKFDVAVTGCCSASRIGLVHGRPKCENQDSLLVCRLAIPHNPYLFLVCDGHGDSGRLVSSYITKIMPCFFLEALEGGGSIEEALSTAYEKTNESLKGGEIDVFLSGSTCVSVVVSGKMLVCGNVGDSRAVLGRRRKDGGLAAVELSKDHKPDEPTEHDRILSYGGRVETQGNSCPRLWYKDQNIPGLAVSRAIGDFCASQIGLIGSPDVMSTPITDQDLFLILASDGVWEFMSSREAVEEVYRMSVRGEQSQAADRLVESASCRWAGKATRIDDITAVVCFFG